MENVGDIFTMQSTDLSRIIKHPSNLSSFLYAANNSRNSRATPKLQEGGLITTRNSKQLKILEANNSV
jgi:hypothetical protein